MSSAALDLLVRLVAEQVAGMACERCGAGLDDSKISLRGQNQERMVVEVICRACDHVALLGVEPEDVEGGVISLR